MLYVKAYVAASSIHGVGLFAGEAIQAGTLISAWSPDFDQEFTPDQVSRLPPIQRDTLRIYGWQLPDGRWRRDADAACYVNHSDAPNMRVDAGDERMPGFAIRDICAGDELTENCREWGSTTAFLMVTREVCPLPATAKEDDRG